MSLLAWLVYVVFIGLTWLLGAIALGSFLLMLGLHLKGRTVGVTRGEQVCGLYGLFGFLGGMIAAMGTWSVAAFIELNHDAAVFRDLAVLQAACSTLGDSQPVPTPRRALLLNRGASRDGYSLAGRTLQEGAAGERSAANQLLRDSLRGGLGSEAVVFCILGPPHAASERGFADVIDVQVIRWPQGTAIGQYQIEVKHGDPLAGFAKGEYVTGEGTSLARWVNELPARAQGDRQRLLEESTRSTAASVGDQP